MVGKRIRCPACSAIVKIDPPGQTEAKPSAPPSKGSADAVPATAEVRSQPAPKPEGSSPAQPTEARKNADAVIRPGRTPSGSILKAIALAVAVAAVLFVIAFLAGGLTAFLMPIVKSLQGAENKGLFYVPKFAILGLLFIGAFLTFNLLPLFVTGVGCASAGEELGEKASRGRHVAAALAVTILGAGLLWVAVPYIQYFPAKDTQWAERTLEIYRWVYVGANAAIGLICAAKAGPPKQQPVESGAAIPRDGV
jgi:hypothetical protein